MAHQLTVILRQLTFVTINKIRPTTLIGLGIAETLAHRLLDQQMTILMVPPQVRTVITPFLILRLTKNDIYPSRVINKMAIKDSV